MNKFYYYVTFIVIFQWGWALVQLSHLSLIPVLTDTQDGQADLNSKRYGMYVVAFIAVYIISFFNFREGVKCVNQDTNSSSSPTWQPI